MKIHDLSHVYRSMCEHGAAQARHARWLMLPLLIVAASPIWRPSPKHGLRDCGSSRQGRCIGPAPRRADRPYGRGFPRYE